jgi:hypothetical protein
MRHHNVCKLQPPEMRKLRPALTLASDARDVAERYMGASDRPDILRILKEADFTQVHGSS